MRRSRYPIADAMTQWYAVGLRGEVFEEVDRIVLHTTEGSWWPPYKGGYTAPNITCRPNFDKKILEWRQHFPLNMASRALENDPGGVETNKLNAVQVELIGTCVVGGPGLYWPGAPDWALYQLADFLKFMDVEWGVPLVAAPEWLPYPSSYGNTSARMTNEEWRLFSGICGHQHVPENDHGDPGALPIARILKLAGVAPAVPRQKGPDMAEWSEQALLDVVTRAIESKKDEIAAEVWNRFVVADEELGKMAPLKAIEKILNEQDDIVERTAKRVVELLKPE